jgi:hypothetical protein
LDEDVKAMVIQCFQQHPKKLITERIQRLVLQCPMETVCSFTQNNPGTGFIDVLSV